MAEGTISGNAKTVVTDKQTITLSSTTFFATGEYNAAKTGYRLIGVSFATSGAELLPYRCTITGNNNDKVQYSVTTWNHSSPLNGNITIFLTYIRTDYL